MIMPGMGGGETFNRMKAMNEDVMVLLSSGYSIDEQAKDMLGQGCVGFIQKPFSITALTDKIRDVLDG
jgi:DNA-binding NtrC family response regulator